MSDHQSKRHARKEATKFKKLMIERVISKSKKNNIAFNLNFLVEGWLELESDPGTFSLLIEDFGCFGAQVDEIYDLEQKIDGPVLGFIFLFKWLNNQQNHVAKDQLQSPSTDDMFFAKQMISNSCATHALISILLNCDHDKLDLGSTLTRLKEHTKAMNPEDRGFAIGNVPELAKAHNSHASYSSLYNKYKRSPHEAKMSYMLSGNQRTNLQQKLRQETYHFVSYIPLHGRLYELDGLRNHPIDHGPIDPKEDWTEKFRQVIKRRLDDAQVNGDSSVSNDIHYSLMAVVPDKRVRLKAELQALRQQHEALLGTIHRLTDRTCVPAPIEDDIPNPPYSPISNATLTASESGSACNSPRRSEERFITDDTSRIDKFLFIKFDSKVTSNSIREPSLEDLKILSCNLASKINKLEISLKEEVDKRHKYKVDSSRRTHNYEPFIMTFLSLLAKEGKLADLIERDLGLEPSSINLPQMDGDNSIAKTTTSMSTRATATAKTTPVAPPKTAKVAANHKVTRGPYKKRAPKDPPPTKPKPKYKYVSTGRPVGRPRKHPLPTPIGPTK